MSYTIKPFEELDLMDDFLMHAIANDNDVNEEFFRILLSVLLQRKIGKIKISAQRGIPAASPTLRGIRMDVEVMEYEDCEENTMDGELRAKNIYDIEPHKRDNINLPKHNRFYQAKIDNGNMKSGEKDFIKLPNLYVVTITNYDPFGYDYMLYTIHNKCNEVPELIYEDGLQYIYFNTVGSQGGNAAIKKLLNYLQDSKINNVTDETTQKLHDFVSKVRVSPEARFEYMTWEEKIFYERLEAKDEGRIEGKIEGKIEATIDNILEILEEHGNLSEDVAERIKEEKDIEKLKSWLKLAAKSSTIQEFVEGI